MGELEEMNQEPEELEAQEELAVVDNAGRLQIPREYLGAIGVSGKARVRVELEDDKVVIINPDYRSGT